jgi:hypothetical protein
MRIYHMAESASPYLHADSSESDEEITILRESAIDAKTVSQHRKAFVSWVNDEFYPQVVQSAQDSPLKAYQVLIQAYLGLDTPYRGLLVYHGLGTGKTASAVSLAEGLSSELRINTLLPASLETEFIKEVRRWGVRELNEDNRWVYKPYKELTKDELSEYKRTMGLDLGALNQIMRQTSSAYKKQVIQDTDATDDQLEGQLRTAGKAIKALRGFWIPDPSGTQTEDLGPIERACVLQQINYLISKKYNFIHYKPFPKVSTSSLPDFLEEEEGEGGEEGEEGEGEGDGDDGYEAFDPVDAKEVRTHNQRIVKRLEAQLKHNLKHHAIDSPFHKEVLIIDEVHNFVRQVLNKSKPSLVFYNWIVNATDVKLVFLSGTPVINRPCEIAILYNMLKGMIRVYSFTIQTKLSPEDMTLQLNEIVYESPSPIELFYVEPKQGKLVISFIQESSGFESMAKDSQGGASVVYTLHTKDATFREFIASIYAALGAIAGKDVATMRPSEQEFKKLSAKELQEIQMGRGHVVDKDEKKREPPMEVGRVFDTDLGQLFNRQQKLFDIYDNGQRVDMTDNEAFMEYFFESRDQIPDKKRVLLKRMLMGLTSYYPIDRSSIVEMPQIVKPTIESETYQNYLILKELNVVPCLMSQVQFEKYNEVWGKEKAMDSFRAMRGGEEAPWHYHTRTRQTCNIVYRKDEFRSIKKTKTNHQEITDLRERAYQDAMDTRSLHQDKDLAKLSPKMFEIMRNMKKFTKMRSRRIDGSTQFEPVRGVSTGKVLFYSDFRTDAGSESFECVLKSNGYERFDTKKPQTTKGLRYTFITGAEAPDVRRINKEFYNEERNRYGEYIQVMIISSAGAEGLSLTCVRQVHLLEPYWNYVRIDQVLGRAIRMRSHTMLEPKDRNVEQYLYLSILPQGTNLDAVYESIRGKDTWDIPEWTDIKTELSKATHKSYKELFESLVNLNLSETERSTDQYLFDVMESKYKVSSEISSVIKESSIDCIPHTRDTPELNDRCVRFSKHLLGEIAYFPGISSHIMETIDTTQLLAKTLVFLKPNVYVVSAHDSQRGFFVYYEHTLQADESRDDIDIRYLRDNATKLGELHPHSQMFLLNVSEPHDDPRLGKEFSLMQKIYGLADDVVRDLETNTFRTIAKLTQESQWVGAKLKYNINQSAFYTEAACLRDPHHIFRMYPYGEYENHLYDVSEIPPIVLYNKEFYIEDD